MTAIDTQALRALSPFEELDKLANTEPLDDGEDGFNIGRRDGFSEAVQYIDQLTGGDGEYRYCTLLGDRHCPDPDSMIARIVARVQAADDLVTMRERVGELEALLQPFAEAADDLDDRHGDDSPIWEASAAMSIDAGDVRRARAALERKPQ